MSRKKKKISNRNVLHYVIAFSCIIMLVIFSMGTYLYRFYYNNMQQDFYENNDLYLSNIVKTHKNEIQILKDISTQIEISKTAKFLLEDQPTKSTELKNQLYQYRSVSQFFDVMYCFYQEDAYLYNHLTSMRLEYFCQDAYCLERFSADEFKEILTAKHKTIQVIPEESLSGEIKYFYNEKKYSAIYIIPSPPSYDCILIFFVGGSHFDTLLADEDENLRNRYIIYDGQIVAKRETCEIEEKELLAQLQYVETQDGGVVFGNESYLLTTKLDSDGFMYASLQNEKIFNGDLRTHSWGIIILLFLCCIPSVILIFVISKSMLGEVRNISRHLSNVENADQYSLESIESGIRDLVEKSQSMKEDQLSLRKNRFIRNFVQSQYTALEILRRDAVNAQINVSSSGYMIGVIGMRADTEEKAFASLLKNISNNKKIDGHGIRLLNSSQYVVVLFGESEELCYAAFDEMLNKGKQSCEEFVVAVSFHHKSLLIGSKAYLEANSAYDSRLLMDNAHVIKFAELGQNESFLSYNELRSRYMVQLENTIRVGSEHEVEAAICELCEKLKQEHAPLLTFRLLYDEILRFLIEQWRGEEKNWNQIYNVFTLSRCLTIEDFTKILTEACHMLLDTRTDAKNQQSELVKQAILKMHQEFSNPELNMSFLAESLGISPVTLAVEFKNETGISPSDYLAVVRLDRAKEMLAQTDMLIRDISSAIGYEDDHVFIRRFKKYTGKTPGQYRKDVRSTDKLV